MGFDTSDTDLGRFGMALSYIELDFCSTFVLVRQLPVAISIKLQLWKAKTSSGSIHIVDQGRAIPMIHVTHCIFGMRSGFINRVWLAIAISLFSWAASAETYPVSGVWIARDDSFPGSTNGACFILKKIGIDAVSSQPFPSLMIFSDNKRFEVRGDIRAERTVRSVQSATDGRFRIIESLGKRWSLLFKRPSFTLKIVDATTIEVASGNISTRFFQCSPNTPPL